MTSDDANGPRLDENQLRQLSTALVDEQAHLFEMTFDRFARNRDKVAWWRGFDPRWARVYGAALDSAKARLSNLFADAVGVDVETAELEIGILWSQTLTLKAVAQGTNGSRSHRDPWPDSQYVAAVKALVRFYFGEQHPGDRVLGETQLAWAASTQPSPLALLQKSMRHRRKTAHRRYRELWEAWARTSGS